MVVVDIITIITEEEAVAAVLPVDIIMPRSEKDDDIAHFFFYIYLVPTPHLTS
ncbi:Hypothetical protein FKW44_024406 [Caligus rogercresseyi]|uniref:Uncharacterized protein n=1 Tax=Caligus rogercresseyi TaxID=217165 RepID=A0A7T8GN71_CALRO|nr:Hypothetical protein FKW44_024406 [Caligus rogercresseyi]